MLAEVLIQKIDFVKQGKESCRRFMPQARVDFGQRVNLPRFGGCQDVIPAGTQRCWASFHTEAASAYPRGAPTLAVRTGTGPHESFMVPPSWLSQGSTSRHPAHGVAAQSPFLQHVVCATLGPWSSSLRQFTIQLPASMSSTALQDVQRSGAS